MVRLNTTRLVHYCVWPTALAKERPKLGRSATASLPFAAFHFVKEDMKQSYSHRQSSPRFSFVSTSPYFSDSSRFSCDLPANLRYHTLFLPSKKMTIFYAFLSEARGSMLENKCVSLRSYPSFPIFSRIFLS